MSGVCDGPYYSCPDFGTAPYRTKDERIRTQRHAADRVFTLHCGDKSVVLNKRERTYTYDETQKTEYTNAKFVTYDGATYQCGTMRYDLEGSIDDTYTTTDAVIHYVDLREDLVVYTETVETIRYNQTNSGGATDSENMQGNIVRLRTNYDAVWAVPFIVEIVPIERSSRIVCTTIAEDLHEYDWDGGYPGEIKIIMANWAGTEPLPRTITIDGKSYQVSEVDWYYPPTHTPYDGDKWFWWADWHKAVGINNEIDSDEAKKMYDVNTGQIATPYETQPLNNGVVAKDFYGSATISADGTLFLSGNFDVFNDTKAITKLVDSEGNEYDTSELLAGYTLHHPIGLY